MPVSLGTAIFAVVLFYFFCHFIFSMQDVRVTERVADLTF